MKIFAKVSIIILMLTFLTGCYKQVDFVGLKSASVSNTNTNGNILLFVEVDNPNFYPIKIVESDIDVYVDNTHLGKIKGIHKIKIPSKGPSIVEIPVKVNIADIIFNVGNIFDLVKNQQTELRISGTITAKALFIKKTIQIDEVSEISL
ncbi:MAG: LEA type 2 family protein [Bacteroidales bacterium]|nr:LEA type 2 family protein [Bacteroidales bacterium]